MSTLLRGLEDNIDRAAQALMRRQRDDGHWIFELEADATIPAEYVLMRHFRGEPLEAELERKIAVYLRRIQGAHGGWPLFHHGAFDMSASVKAYFALKMIGDSVDAEHMRRAREAIRARGGAARANVFTRTLLALYGQISWRAVPMMPAEERKRPGATTEWSNLWLAGDWTATGLPATIEGAIRSGQRAAELLSNR